MLYEFKLPDIGEGVVEGEVVRWLVQEGDVVREDQPLVEIMTDKATVEIPAPRAGRIGKRMFAEGQLCPVGRVLVTIETEAAASKNAPAPAATPANPLTGSGRVTEASRAASGHAGRAAGSPAANGSGAAAAWGDGASGSEVRRAPAARDGAPVLATPATRKLARDLGVDIRAVPGTGRGGRITSDDVRQHQSQGAPSGASPRNTAGAAAAAVSLSRTGAAARPDVRIPFRGVRKKIAENLVRSKHTAAHYTYVEEVDCTDLVALRHKANERLASRQIKLSYLPFIIKATVAALQKFPQLNATLDEQAGEIVQRGALHIGLATTTENGLIVPVIRDADRRSLVELAQEIQRLAGLTRAGKASREELSGSTFTVTSPGKLGGLLATPIINHPEVAILGVHKIARRPAAVGDQIVLRDLMNLSLSVDHRLVDGYQAAEFVAEIKATLETPGLLFLDSI